jgi:tetratricopeptide (TPR) repeat protein
MKSRLLIIAIIAFCVAIGLLVIFSGIIVWRFMFLPPCTPVPGSACLVDAGSVAGLAATVMGVAAAILALLGAFAVAAWWTSLDIRINEQVTKLTNEQVNNIFTYVLKPSIDKQVKDLESRITEANDKLQAFDQVQDETIKKIESSSRALLYLVMGNRLLEQKKISAAIDIFKKAKQLQPDDTQVNYILGQTYRTIGLYDGSIDCLEAAIASEKEFPLAYYELGWAYRNRADELYGNPELKQKHDEEYDKAILNLKEATRLLPDDEEIIATLGGTYRRYERYSDALNCYNRALMINPDSSYALGNVALLSWHEGKLDDSRKAFRRTEELANKRIATKISNEPFWDFYDLAMAKLALGRKDEALEDYRLAVKFTNNPDNFKSVLSGIFFLKNVEDKYPISGLNEALAIVEAGKTEAENRIAKQTTP